MPNQTNRRVLTMAAALGLALGTGVLALAAPADLPEEAADQAHAAVADAPAQPANGENGQDAAGENAEAFSAWVQSIPDDWGCVRGKLVSSMARQHHRGSDFEGPTYGSLEEAAADLGMEDRRCVEAAANGEADEESEIEGSRAPEGVPSGPPTDIESAGPPDGIETSQPDDIETGQPDDVPPSLPDEAEQETSQGE